MMAEIVSLEWVVLWVLANGTIFSAYSFSISLRQENLWWKWFIHSCGVGHLIMPAVMLVFHAEPLAWYILILWDVGTAVPSVYVAYSQAGER